MEEEAAGSNESITDECDKEDAVVAMLETVASTSERQSNKEQIGQSVDYLSRIDGCIVILE